MQAPFYGVRKGDKKKYVSGKTYSKAGVNYAKALLARRTAQTKGNVFTG